MGMRGENCSVFVQRGGIRDRTGGNWDWFLIQKRMSAFAKKSQVYPNLTLERIVVRQGVYSSNAAVLQILQMTVGTCNC